jgi:hypothetical protein
MLACKFPVFIKSASLLSCWNVAATGQHEASETDEIFLLLTQYFLWFLFFHLQSLSHLVPFFYILTLWYTNFPYPPHYSSCFLHCSIKKVYLKECWSESLITMYIFWILCEEFSSNCTGVPLFRHWWNCTIDVFIIWWDEVSLSCR